MEIRGMDSMDKVTVRTVYLWLSVKALVRPSAKNCCDCRLQPWMDRKILHTFLDEQNTLFPFHVSYLGNIEPLKQLQRTSDA